MAHYSLPYLPKAEWHPVEQVSTQLAKRALAALIMTSVRKKRNWPTPSQFNPAPGVSSILTGATGRPIWTTLSGSVNCGERNAWSGCAPLTVTPSAGVAPMPTPTPSLIWSLGSIAEPSTMPLESSHPVPIMVSWTTTNGYVPTSLPSVRTIHPLGTGVSPSSLGGVAAWPLSKLRSAAVVPCGPPEALSTISPKAPHLLPY